MSILNFEGFLEALAAIAVSLSVLMAGAWLVQQRSGNSGWVDTIWTFSLGLTGAASALWPVAGAAPNPRQWLVAALVAVWSIRLGSHIAARTAGIPDDPRYAAFAREWGVNSPRRMFVFLARRSASVSFLLSLGLGDLAGPDLHVLDPGACHRHPAAGSADAALARRALPRLSIAHQRVLSVATTRNLKE